MRPDTKLKVARRKHTIEVLRWLYSRREPKLDGAALSLEHRKRQEGGVANSRPFTYGEVCSLFGLIVMVAISHGGGDLPLILGCSDRVMWVVDCVGLCRVHVLETSN